MRSAWNRFSSWFGEEDRMLLLVFMPLIWRARSYLVLEREFMGSLAAYALTFWKLIRFMTGGLTLFTIHSGVACMAGNTHLNCLFK